MVYSKWYQGRATFFSRKLFTALLRKSLHRFDEPHLSPTDGAFPSLAVGATKHLYEDLLNEARVMTEVQADKIMAEYLPEGNLFRKFLDKVRREK